MWLILSVLFWAVWVALLAWFIPKGLWLFSKTHKNYLAKETDHFFIAHFIFVKSGSVLGAMGLALFISALILVLVGVPVLLAMVLVLIALGVWPIYLRYLHKKRVLRFEKQFPDFLLALASALRAGSSLRICLLRVVHLSHAPLRQEMELFLKEQRMGLSLSQALGHLHTRLNCESTSLFKSALIVAGQSGGGLADLLENMALTISKRLYIEGRVQALTAQGRLQAWVMVLLPVLVGVALYWLDPTLIAPLWQQPSGQVLLVLMVLLEVIGLWWIQRLVNVPL